MVTALALLIFNEIEQQGTKPIRVMRHSDESLSFSSMSDGPFLVTHLVRYSEYEGDKAVAPLPQAIVIIDSHGAMLTAREGSKLSWVILFGEPTKGPASTDELKGLFYRSQVSNSTDRSHMR